MKWRSISFVAIVFLCILYGAYLGAAQYEYPLVSSFIVGSFAGLIVGLIVVVLLWVILELARIFREKKPYLARLVGNIFFWLGSAAAVSCVGLAAYVSYVGISAEVIAMLLGSAFFYLALGWGIRRILAANSNEDIAMASYALPKVDNYAKNDSGAIRNPAMRLLRGLLAILSMGLAIWIVYFDIKYWRQLTDPIWLAVGAPPILLLNAFCLISMKSNGGPRIFRLLSLWLEVKESDLRSRLRGSNSSSHSE